MRIRPLGHDNQESPPCDETTAFFSCRPPLYSSPCHLPRSPKPKPAQLNRSSPTLDSKPEPNPPKTGRQAPRSPESITYGSVSSPTLERPAFACAKPRPITCASVNGRKRLIAPETAHICRSTAGSKLKRQTRP